MFVPMVSIEFPMFFLWLPNGFAIGFQGFPMVSHGSLIFHGCRMVVLWFSHGFQRGFKLFSHVVPWFSNGSPMVFL